MKLNRAIAGRYIETRYIMLKRQKLTQFFVHRARQVKVSRVRQDVLEIQVIE